MMADASAAGAPSHDMVDWHAINWYKAHRTVRRLQARIVKATQEGRWGKVHALHHLLTHSFSGKALAIRRVTENHGKQTPGVDRVIWDTPTKKARAMETLRQRGYQPQPLRRVYIPKGNGTMRPLSIATMRDRAMQTLYLFALAPSAETTADPNSYGFRKDRSTADAIEQCFVVLAKQRSPHWILEGDIRDCFGHLSHAWLLAHVPMDKRMLRKWLKAGYLDHQILYPTEEGVPQGGPICPVLANLALDGLEQQLLESYPKPKRGDNAKVNLIRFADDFIITGATKEVLEQGVKPLVDRFLQERGLSLSPTKTVITSIEDGFDFLGQNVRTYHGKLIIKPARKNVRAFLTTVRTIVKNHKQSTAGHLILLLNPVIRGWARYHQHVCSTTTFNSVDRAIFDLLWRWARRRHPNKGARWVRKKYFQTVGSRTWVFSGTFAGPKGHPQVIRLCAATDIPIRRHVKIRGAANPYDPAWEEYFEYRLGVQMAHNLAGRRTLLYLWKEQGGLCPRCGQKITELTGWHNHHIVWRSKGGSDSAGNRVLLHPTCHLQVHSRKETVAKPCPRRGV